MFSPMQLQQQYIQCLVWSISRMVLQLYILQGIWFPWCTIEDRNITLSFAMSFEARESC